MSKLLTYFGYVKESDINVPYPEDFILSDTLDLKLDYLKALDSQENGRQSTIETKTSQLIGQAGIIFSLLSLFIANYISKFSSFPPMVQTVLILLFLVTLLFYLSTINQATKYMNIHKYIYGQRSVSTVLNQFNNDDKFKIEEIRDLIYSINRNTLVNNQKCNNLIYAYRSFKVGTASIGLLSVLLITSGYFLPKQEIPKIIIEKPISISELDTSIKLLRERNIITVHDTVYLKK